MTILLQLLLLLLLLLLFLLYKYYTTTTIRGDSIVNRPEFATTLNLEKSKQVISNTNTIIEISRSTFLCMVVSRVRYCCVLLYIFNFLGTCTHGHDDRIWSSLLGYSVPPQ